MVWTVAVDFRPSTTHGTGVFAGQWIPKGTVLWRYDATMHLCDRRELTALDPETLRFALHGGYLHQPSGKFLWYRDGMQFMNHASGAAANVGLAEWPELRDERTVALRDIARGEELFEDYGFWSSTLRATDHWLTRLYRKYCPEHYAFLMMLDMESVAA